MRRWILCGIGKNQKVTWAEEILWNLISLVTFFIKEESDWGTGATPRFFKIELG